MSNGLFFFYAVCAVGAFVNIQVAGYLFGLHVPWCGAGLMGAIIGSVWNYGVSSIIVWSRHLSPHAKKCILAIGDVGPARARGLCIRLADRL